MKYPIRLHQICASIAAGVAMLGATAYAAPLDDSITYTNSFDTAASATSWIYWYGVNPGNAAMTWDSTVDAATNANSGSLLFEATFPANDQQAFFGTFGNRYAYDTGDTHDATKYTNIVCDVLVDPSSAMSTAGTYGQLQFGFYNGPGVLGYQPIPADATNHWVHIVQPIDPTQPMEGAVSGIRCQIQTYDNYNNPIGHLKFWIDNLKMVVSPVKIPPPTLNTKLVKPKPGLNLLSSPSNGDQYQRISIFSSSHSGVGWIGSPTPVTYALNIADFPSGSYTNFQAHIFITTGNPPPSYETAVDYNETNVIFFDIHQNPNGTASANFRYKVNEGNQNSNLFGMEYIGPASAGTIASLTSSNVLGTWSLTFNQDTNVTITAPGGASTNFVFRLEAASNFVEPLNLVFGAQPNKYSDASPLFNVGQTVILGGVGVTNGDTTIISDNFLEDSSLDPGLWTRLSGDVNTIQLIPPDAAFWIKWGLPDTDFGLQVSTNINDPNSWVSITGPESGGMAFPNYTSTGSRNTLLTTSALPGGSATYFRLLKQNFTQLQLLLPGETATPGIPPGKTGTPLPQQAGFPIDVVVNAVDSRWFPVTTVNDMVSFTSNDPDAILPANTPLFSGTVTVTAYLVTTGTNQTITVSDATDSSKLSATSPKVTITP